MLKYLTDKQLQDLEYNAEYRTYGMVCPVCLDTGQYKYLGEEHECPDDDYGHVMLRLAKTYWLSNIPLQYQKLTWEKWPYDDLKVEVQQFIDQYQFLRMNGVGITLYSKMTGTGKTWAATHVLRELVKQGYDGWFAPFYEVKGYFEIEDKREKNFRIDKVQHSGILVLDEVRKPYTERMREFYAETLEELLRPRSDSNLPTIITTNMTPDELEENYPRVFSLMSAKNMQLNLDGYDARVGSEVWQENVVLGLNGEVKPLS